MTKPTRKQILLGSFVVLIGVYAWLFGVQTFFALKTRNIGRKIPIVNSVPTELRELSVSNARGEKLSFQGAEFEVPWIDLDEGKTRIVGNWLFVFFRSGYSIILCVGPQDVFIKGLSKDKTPDPGLFSQIYGPQVLHSDYTLQQAIFETTPSQITLFTPAKRAVELSLVIVVKAVMPPTTDWTIYNVRSSVFKGFQLGDPAHRPKRMCLELYGPDAHFEIVISQDATASAAAITQADLNRIIQSAHLASHKLPTLAVNPS
jgi:hypothetical protein